MIFDLAIIGGGPAGIAAGVYASRKKLTTVFITKDYQSQSAVSPDIQNWIGTISISGADLAKNLENHLKAYAGDIVTIVEQELGESVEKTAEGFSITTDKGNTFEARTILIATGSRRRKLTVEGADEFEHKGITYCATCDGPLFTDKDVVVVGGGNAGFETAAQLLAYTKSVTLLNRNEQYKADPVTVEKVLAHPNMKGITNAHLEKIQGEQFVNSIVYRIGENGEPITLATEGIFAEIGAVPNTGLVKGLVEFDAINRIVANPKNQRTSASGIWAAGDCTDGLYHQNNIAAGDAVKALEDIYLYLRAK